MEVQDPTKVRLLEAAGEEFASKGYDSARIRAICDRADANIAAVNYHFGDKEQLYVEAILAAHRCGPIGESEAALEGSPAEQLRGFIHNFLCRVLAIDQPNDWRHVLMLREMMNPTSASDVLVRERIRPRFEQLQGILCQFCPAADGRKMNALAFSVIGQCLHYRMAQRVTDRLIGSQAREALDVEYLTEHITSFCLAALGWVPPLGEAGEPVAMAEVSR